MHPYTVYLRVRCCGDYDGRNCERREFVMNGEEHYEK